MLAGAAMGATALLVWLVLPRHAEPDAFVAPRNATLSLELGSHAHAALVGPARLDVLDTIGDATAVALRSGTLLAEFEGGPGRSLRIVTPSATIEIVGTLFAIEGRDPATCVWVAHGKVRMTTFARVIEIGGGQAACSDDVAPHAVTQEVRTALARHAAVIAASDPPAITQPVPAAPPVAITSPPS